MSAATVVGEHRLVERLGAGGMGEVWSGLHLPTGTLRALKLIRGADAAGLLRFQREAEALARIEGHPNLVRVHAAGIEGGLAWIAMELLPGGDLERRIEAAGPLPPEEAVRLVRDLALAVAHAHRRGVLHRDLKPSNVLFDAEGRPKLVDLGLAWLVGSRSLTGTGELAGTPAYMAPEQARGERVDERVDVYGLGALLYHALTGRPPFRGPTPLATLQQVLAGGPPRPSQLRGDVPPRLERELLRALARDPGARHASALELARDLDAALLGRPAVGPVIAVAIAAVLGLSFVALRGSRPAESPAPVQPPPRADPGPTPSSAKPLAPVASVWSERLSTARRVDRAPYEPFEGAELLLARERAEKRLEEGLAPTREDQEQLELGAARGIPRARLVLALSLLARGEHEAARAEEQLWLASRNPPSAATLRAAMLLAARLAEADRAPAVSRFLLEEYARVPVDVREQSRTGHALAACAWARLGGTGDLGRALRLLRDCPRRALQECSDPAAPALLAASYRLGWGRAETAPDESRAEEELRASLRAPKGPTRRVGLAICELFASLGDPVARRALGSLQLPPAETFPPGDLLELDGTAVVHRPVDAELEALVPRLLGASPGVSDRARVRGLAELGFAPSQAELAGQLHKAEKDAPARLCWLVRAGLDASTGPGDVKARARAGRLLLLGKGAGPEPERAVLWLRSVFERQPALSPKEVLLVRLWLGMARASGRGIEQDVLGGLREMRDALAQAARLDDGTAWLHDAWEADASGDAWADWTISIVDAGPLGDPDLGRLGEAARTDSEARRLLELLASDAAKDEPAWRRRAQVRLAHLQAPR